MSPSESYGPFNAQLVRIGIIAQILRSLGPEIVVETGTFLGETTAFLARCLPDVPIRTVEVTPLFAGYARELLAGFQTVDVLEGSSADVLSRSSVYLLPGGHKARCGFAYLDAHWGDVNPLAQELVSLGDHLEDFVAVIDDAEVPGDNGYGFDDGAADDLLRANSLRDWCRSHGLEVAWPTTPSSLESGYRRGTAFVAGGPRGRKALASVSELTWATTDSERKSSPPPGRTAG